MKIESPDDSLHIAICGGGSGGHLTPGIAIVEALQQSLQTSAVFVCSARPIDGRVLDRWIAQSNNATTLVQPLTSSRPRLRFLKGLWAAYRLARTNFRKRRPDVVLGTGGFASIPGVLAAWRSRIPVALLEPNAVAGSANLKLQRFASIVLAGNSTVAPAFRISVEAVGVPLRAESGSEYPVRGKAGEFRLLVLGGSQGAAGLNRLVVASLSKLQLPNLHVIHQAGTQHADAIANEYTAAGIQATVVPFMDDVPAELRAADAVVSRAGAVTLAEIQRAACPAIVIPLRGLAGDHQLHNARLAESNGAKMIDETSPDNVQQLSAAIEAIQATPPAATSSNQTENSAFAAATALLRLARKTPPPGFIPMN